MTGLHQILEYSAQARPDHPAVEEEDGTTMSYQALNILSNRLRDRLHHIGVRPGDRVGIYMQKSVDAVASIFGILKVGAAYVPVDPGAPPARNGYILNDCTVKAVIIEKSFSDRLRSEMGGSGDEIPFLLVEGTGGGRPLRETLDDLHKSNPAPVTEPATVSPDDLAYILYTSGSTGRPKGVTLSHRNAISFIDWCSEVFEPDETARFSSHAPFHFDLSILDLYVPIKHGATLVLIGAQLGKDPVRLAAFISEKRLTNWYSTPSILSLLTHYGNLQAHDYSALRVVLFAGEVFPLKHLRALKTLLPAPRYFNLYGPTETNVCTFYEIPAHVPDERTQPYPIGKVCAHFQARVVDELGQEVQAGQEGELCISGAGVMRGYWNLPQRSAQAFLTDSVGQCWYRTGDVVVEEADGNYTYVGRRDRMVKKRGYRVELGEVEAGLYRHPMVKEVAVIAGFDDEHGVRIKAFLSCKEGVDRLSLIELKRFCVEILPPYMIPDQFAFREMLPKTSTDKIDYQALKNEL